jgi:hypothetical protein
MQTGLKTSPKNSILVTSRGRQKMEWGYLNYFDEIKDRSREEQLEILEKARYEAFVVLGMFLHRRLHGKLLHKGLTIVLSAEAIQRA